MPQTILSDVERRAIGNLSIPRTVADLQHELRTDPYFSPSLDAGALHYLLVELQDAGYVVNVGDGRDQSPGALAALVDSHHTARSMPDEKARLFEQRLAVPHRSWRLDGDVWVFTDAGFDKLHEPVMDPGPADKATVERLLREHGQAILEPRFEGSIHDANGGILDDGRADSEISLASILNEAGERSTVMLPEEFGDWSRQVIEEFEARTGQRILPPMGGGAGYSDAWENLGIDAENGKGTGFAVTPPWFMALCTVAVTDADTGSTITEAAYTGYARKSVAATDMNTAASGAATNANAIVYAACTAGTATVIGFAKCIAATVGVLQKYGTLASTTISTTQTPAQFAAGAFSTSLD
jgi:hypothetical protein